MSHKIKFKISNIDFFTITIILVLAFSRLVPHPPNFTPIIALAMIGGYFFRNLYMSLVIVLISMLLLDSVIGFHSNILFVYSSLIFIIIIFFNIKDKINFKNLYI